jgi:hypothetical protein
MLRYFPALAEAPVEARWSGTLGITLDRVCTMGVRGEHRNVYYALGYSGHGLALALLAAACWPTCTRGTTTRGVSFPSTSGSSRPCRPSRCAGSAIRHIRASPDARRAAGVSPSNYGQAKRVASAGRLMSLKERTGLASEVVTSS